MIPTTPQGKTTEAVKISVVAGGREEERGFGGQ